METFFEAVEEGDEVEATRLLNGDPGLLEEANKKGNRPLAVAAARGHLGLVKLLFQRGASTDPTGVTGMTALHWAASKGQEGVVTFLLDQGAQANNRDVMGETPLMLACGEGHLGVVSMLLQHMGAQALHQADDKERTALHLAALRGHGEMVAFLLGQGADTNSTDIFHRTPLLSGCSEGRLGVARMLLEHMGGGALEETGEIGRRALHFAAFGGHEEVAAFLLSKGAQVNSRDFLDQTPLMLACEKGHVGVVRMLAQHMGEEGLKETDANGRTILHWAVEKGYHEAVKLLLLAGADPTITDNEGRTPRALAEGEEGRAAQCVVAFKVRVQIPCKPTITDPSV
jgi:ankyrin repeat protein